MKILKYFWKNFNSYGNIEQELDLTQTPHSLNLISANNGYGKTTIFEVLEFCLFGKVGGKVLSDLPNRVNENLETRAYIEVKNNKLVIERRLNPGGVVIDLDGDELSDMAGKRNVQAYVENSLYDIDNFMFKNLVALDINKFKSFVKMSKYDKKNLIDKVFGLNILTKMLEELRGELRTNQMNENKLKDQIDELNDHIGFADEKIVSLKKKIEEYQEEKKEDLVTEISSLNDTRKVIAEKFDNINEAILKLKQKIKKHTELKKGYEFEKRSLDEKIKLYTNNKVCPMCGSDFELKEHQNHLQNYQHQLTVTKESLKQLEEESEKLTERNHKYSKLRDEGNQKLSRIVTQIENLNFQIKKLNVEKKEDVQIVGLLEIIENDKEKLEVKKVELEDVQNELQFLNIIVDVIGENGIKKHIIDKIIPSLNYEINTILEKINLNYTLKLDSNLETKVISFGRELSINTLSTGEHKKFDFAVLIGFIKLLKLNFYDLNVLFLDEIFSGLDMESIELVCTELKDLSEELKIHIFLVNHSLLDSNMFDSVIQVCKDSSGFSYLNQN